MNEYKKEHYDKGIRLCNSIFGKLGSTSYVHASGRRCHALKRLPWEQQKIQYVVCLHEQACSIAAEAYARVTNKPGLLMVTTGPGGTNALTGVTAAYIESTPMIVLSGQVKRADMVNGQGIRQQGMQEVDIISMVKPVTKYAALVTEPQDIRYHLDRALYEAIHGRKGPVWLDIPLDVQASMIEETALRGWKTAEISEQEKNEKRKRLEQQVMETIEQLNQARRPVLLAGNGIRLSEGRDEFENW